ncbi:TrbI/VirB10 family protein [Novosphingobium sp. B 225]|uniref:TrbI/VirB10 family protein n=1 Tax=Novosphingobium sp. B 225 TaxID=1961849 RepID=UPI000B4ACBC4|nr:TrbI/VirB10 family protein [Novosphingobium sp. B 225]
MSEETMPDPASEGRPLVAGPVRNRAVWIFAGAMALGAIGLFSALEARRQSVVTRGTIPRQVAGSGTISAPPELAVPADSAWADAYGYRPTVGGLQGLGAGSAQGFIPPPPTVPTSVPRTLPGVPSAPRVQNPPYYQGPPIALPPAPTSPAVEVPAPPQPAAGAGANRVTASRFANPGLTVPQGAIIQAVLETALDSNRPGFARAIISRDVRSFDGSKVLIQRGSRLFGEYQADVALGQNRIGINWQRLTRPDGVQIALDSPAADPQGRTGVKGKVNSHFFSRFGAAILQSALDIGVGLATRSVTDGTVILGLPGSTNSVQVPGQEAVKPTIKVKQGSSVSVFVTRDLDFSSVEQ